MPESTDVSITGDVSKRKRKRIGATARRAQLIEVAEQVFIRQGYERTSMEQIAEEAEVTRTLVYQHFPAKRDLYMAVVERVIPEFMARVIPKVDVRPKHPWRLLAGFRSFLGLLNEEEAAVKLLLSERPKEPWIADRMEKLVEVFVDYFASEYEGLAPDKEVRILARCYLGMLESVAHVWPMDKKYDLDIDELARLLSRFVWGGMRSFDLPPQLVDKKYADEPPQKWRPDLEYLEALAEQMPEGIRPGERRS